MKRLNGFMHRQGQLLLENRQYAILYAVLLALLPFTAWLSVAVIALVTLKKGWQEGGIVLLPVLVSHIGLSLSSISMSAAVVNSLIIFVPCYLAACSLRICGTWQAVSAVFFLQVILAAIFLQIVMPEFITAQYLYIQAILNQAQPDHVLSGFMNDTVGVKQLALANYLFGILAASTALGSMVSLMSARSMQSRLSYPGGFKQEVLTFRGHKIGLAFLVGMSLAAFQGNVIGMDALPILVLYFLLAGLSLCANALSNKKSRVVCVILLAPLVILPFVMLPVYVILGSLDSLFNLRVYLLRA